MSDQRTCPQGHKLIKGITTDAEGNCGECKRVSWSISRAGKTLKKGINSARY